jgi:hypothetical protein
VDEATFTKCKARLGLGLGYCLILGPLILGMPWLALFEYKKQLTQEQLVTRIA